VFERLRACLLLLCACFIFGCASAAREHEATGNPENLAVTRKVAKALADEPLLKGAEIHVDTHEGIVQLTGVIDSRAEMDRAVELARAVSGVKSVLNDMQVK